MYDGQGMVKFSACLHKGTGRNFAHSRFVKSWGASPLSWMLLCLWSADLLDRTYILAHTHYSLSKRAGTPASQPCFTPARHVIRRHDINIA
jgi:hypothetical protein